MDKLNLWNYGAEGAGISAVVAAAGTVFSACLGGWGKMGQALGGFMAGSWWLPFLSG